MASVLIVDDTLFMRASIKQMLEAEGHTVAGEAANGKEAVERYSQVKPDVILMDITMPDMDGLEALRLIKEMDPNARVVMCTAMGQQAMVAKAVELGAQQFIVKPFKQERLMEAIKVVCGN
ncbi:MAG: response regulator [Lachnospiraceae bacterium]|nr:response regulator [Lachnospiraceae bacterium]